MLRNQLAQSKKEGDAEERGRSKRTRGQRDRHRPGPADALKIDKTGKNLWLERPQEREMAGALEPRMGQDTDKGV
jgi:hypothetical protein